MINIIAVRTAYPTPRSFGDNDNSDASYCVGGAICLYTELQEVGDARFPNKDQLALVLEELNPQLSCHHPFAQYMAQKIIDKSDHERYEDAWEVASQALEWRLYREEL